MPDLHEYLSLPAYGAAIVFYSVLTLYSGRGRRPRSYSKPFPVVIAIHAMLLATVLFCETALLLAYSSLPAFLTSERHVQGIGFSLAGVFGVCIFVGAIYLERGLVFASDNRADLNSDSSPATGH
jgi:hypothetical protein